MPPTLRSWLKPVFSPVVQKAALLSLIHIFILSHIEEHSKKPDETWERIVRLMGDLPRVELFARQSPEGWDVWGNEVECIITFGKEETDNGICSGPEGDVYKRQQ